MTDDNLERRWANLLVKVDKATRSKKILWEADFSETSDGEDFVADMGSVDLNLYKARGSRGVKIVLRLLKHNERVDSFTDEEISTETLEELGVETNSTYTFMNSLLEFIHRRVSGADEIIDDLIKEIDEL